MHGARGDADETLTIAGTVATACAAFGLLATLASCPKHGDGKS